MRTHFLHPGHRKKRLARSRLSDVLSRRMALRTHNLTSSSLKNRLCWRRWSNVSWWRKAIRTHFQHPKHRKKRLVWCRLSDVLNRRMGCRSIICLLNVLKCDLGDIDEATFCDVETPFESIFYILGIQKSYLYEVVEVGLSRRIALRTHNLPSGRLKKRLWWSRWSVVSWCRKAIRTNFLHRKHWK
jgi:hypothetical protein